MVNGARELRTVGNGFAELSRIPKSIDLSPYGIKLILTERAMQSYLRNHGVAQKVWDDDYTVRIVNSLPNILRASPENLKEGVRYQKDVEGVIVIDDLILSVNLEGLARPNDCWRQIRKPQAEQYQDV